jgi:WD40 repeat protein
MAVRPSDGELFVWNNSGDGTSASAETGVLLTVDPGTGQGTPVNSSTPPQGDIGALAFSPSGALYGFADRVVTPEEGSPYLVSDLVSVNPSTGVKTLIAQISPEIRVGGADFSCGGTLYGVEINAFGTDRLVTIDLATGMATVIATLDIGVIGSIVSHFGALLGSAEGNLFEINPTTGEVSNVRPIAGFSTPQGLGTTHTCFPGPT